ncbi:MAG: DNA starvation/stationary phase protection protein Dps [Sphingomonadales bacterium RIFCSPHIGHO2_01_FULL_65_20]|uniref:DNA starvation/stationary phase protection protein Dps n=1 Tax=unclassified Blastomonas TaxID=2626550 RepID=UPI000836B764|nr:DNA starvation/stationary phase protection protein Dps [Blastomonas sp.]MCH2238071.1 DNA starvation/stationary phase protection protein Dps [Blastomonas sp.]OHC92848.1 MAG: DNA starvation/stationary phase protection protein Dps [Sphingomonadales bacterium RIFCSPHIGHO2_01_FULL_65_20]
MTYTSRIDLSDHVRKQACALLQARLSDALDLEAQTKQAHWNVKGPHFLQLHQLFDSVHDEIEQFVDLLAERITALGHVADGRVTTTASATTLYGYPIEATGGEAHLKALAGSLGAFGKAVREAIDQAGTIGDADTADLFTQISRETDKQLWFLEAHLQAH